MPTVYRSSDASAPVLNGNAGSLVTVLDAVLVDGYGAQAAAGWTKSYSGTNKAAYRQGGGNQFYLRIQDDAPGAGGGRQARARGYETMSDVDTGTELFPTVAQLANGLFPRKSTSADGTARSWICVADDRTLYVFVLTGDTAGVYLGWLFGDIYSVKSGDGFRTILVCHDVDNNGSQSSEPLAFVRTALSQTMGGSFIARTHAGTGGSLQIGLHADRIKGNDQGTGFGHLLGTLPFSNFADAGVFLSRVWIHEVSTIVRGYYRGFWQWLHPVGAVADGDTFAGTGDLAGRTFLVIKGSANSGIYVLETSAWDASA